MDLETLRTQCLSCTRCPLHTTRTNVVFGQGVPTAEVDRKSTRLNSSHGEQSRMPSSA